MALANLRIYYAWKTSNQNTTKNKFKISAPIADIQDYFEFIIKKHETLTDNQPVQVYPNKIKKGIVFKIKTGYKLELLTPETMRFLRCTKKGFDKDKNSENVPKLQNVAVVLVYCDLFESDY